MKPKRGERDAGSPSMGEDARKVDEITCFGDLGEHDPLREQTIAEIESWLRHIHPTADAYLTLTNAVALLRQAGPASVQKSRDRA